MERVLSHFVGFGDTETDCIFIWTLRVQLLAGAAAGKRFLESKMCLIHARHEQNALLTLMRK